MNGDDNALEDASSTNDDEIVSEELSGSNPNAISAWHLALQQSGDKYGSSSESFTLSVMENGGGENDGVPQRERDTVQRLHAQLQQNTRMMREEAKHKNQQLVEDHNNNNKASTLEKEQQTIPYPTAPAPSRKSSSTSTKVPAPPDLNRRDDYRQPGAIAVVGTHQTQGSASGVALLDDRTDEVDSEQMPAEAVPKEPSSHMVNAELVTEEASSLPHVAATSAVPMEEDDLPLSQQRLRSILKDRRVALCLCSFILVVAGLATGLSMLFLQKDDDNGITIPATPSPTTLPPTPSPTSRMPWLQTLLGKYVDDVTPWETANSPQSKAILWLAKEDTWRPTYEHADGLTVERFMLERYAMMVLYYSLDGPNWDEETASFLDLKRGICEWQLQSCSSSGCGTFGVQCRNIIYITEQFVSSISVVDDINAFGTIPTEVGLLSSLQTIHFQNNTGLVGTLPKELFLIPTLERVSLSGNGLSGSLPSEILKAPSLISLDLSDNDMNGTIENIANPLLDWFAISENRFTGTIPASLGDLKTATYMELGDNLLTGTLPNSLSNIVSLAYLSLYNNVGLTGPVPTSYYKLANLATLFLEGTNLTQIEWPFCGPSSGGSQQQPPPDYQYFYAECGGGSSPNTTPKVSCWCCTHCCDYEKGVCLRNTRRGAS